MSAEGAFILARYNFDRFAIGGSMLGAHGQGRLMSLGTSVEGFGRHQLDILVLPCFGLFHDSLWAFPSYTPII